MSRFRACPRQRLLGSLRWPLSWALIALTIGCVSSRAPREVRRGFQERGLASWYGPGFDGRPAASGETFDMYALTAAHRWLPFDTVVEVRNRDNGRRVTVRINDRGPFVRGRIIDLSYSAARQLGMIGVGVAPVELRVVSTGRTPALPAGGRFWIQAGAFRDSARARELLRRLRADFADVEMSSEGEWHRVRLGPFKKRKSAERTLRELQRRGVEAFVLQL